MARLLQQLDVPDPLDASGKTVLHNTVLVLIAECLPVGHGSNGVPTMLLGGGGGHIKSGGNVLPGGGNNKQVMATVLKMFGLPGAHFGDDRHRGGAVMKKRAALLLLGGAFALACEGMVGEPIGGPRAGRPGNGGGNGPGVGDPGNPNPGPGNGGPGNPGPGNPGPGDPGGGSTTPPPSAQVPCPDTGRETPGRRVLRRLTGPEYEATRAGGLRPGHRANARPGAAARSGVAGRVHQQRRPAERQPGLRARHPGDRPARWPPWCPAMRC